MSQADLSRLLRPKSIAFIGGNQMAGPIRTCRRGSFTGDIWLVNPTHEAIEGIKCVPSVEELPHAPDAAVVGVSPARSIGVVASLAAIGAGGAVVISSGFAELGEDGAARQQELKVAAGAMPVLGPNCMGILNQFDGAAVWADDNHLERIDGFGAAIISQSGALSMGFTNNEEAFPLGYAISTGNQAVTDMADCILGVLADERVRAIGLYVEGINDGEALGRACWQAMAKDVPVVALKGGDQAEGARVALSHTASMMLERDLWEAFCVRYGVVEVSSPKALVEALKLLTVAGTANGNRLALISYSGGLNGLAATRAGPLGLQLPAPDPEKVAALSAILPQTAVVANPFDLNVPFRTRSGISLQDTQVISKILTDFCADLADQMVFFIDIPKPGIDGLDAIWRDSIIGMPQIARQLGIPCAVAGILPQGLDVGFRRWLMENGVAALCGYAETMEALALSAKLGALKASLLGGEPPARLFAGKNAQPAQIFDEATAKQMLAQHGLTTPIFEAVPLDEAGEVAERIGYPVAVKVLSTTITHKARVGGVKLNLNNKREVEQAAGQIACDVAKFTNGAVVKNVLVERMVDGSATEIIIGIKRHPAMGLAMMLGQGGGNVERLANYQTLLLPLTANAIEEALANLGLEDNRALRGAMNAVASFAKAECKHLVTLDVNPVMLTGDGRAIAADALIIFGQECEGHSDASH